MNTGLLNVPFRGQNIQIECRWIHRELADAPLLVFLHEGLGSVALWKDFPQSLCDAGGFRGLVFSRYGYGQSTPRPPDEKWPVEFMHEQALFLPAFFEAAGIASSRPWLFGHSDGASIALIYAAQHPGALSGAVVLAPHLFVENISVRSIELARKNYLEADLRQKLKRYHADVDSAFWGWNDIWLSPDFRQWNIEDMLGAIRCPVLAIQGLDDEYGTVAQIEALKRRVANAELLTLAGCRHSPHVDQRAAVIEATVTFIREH